MGVRKKISNQGAIDRPSQNTLAQSGEDGDTSQLSPRERIWLVVAAIPRGSVATYGQIADLAGMPRHARLVGRTLSDLPAETKLPWHRVVNASLRISLRAESDGHNVQRRRLEAEGVEFVGRAESFRPFTFRSCFLKTVT